jgi:hypothetical protein
MTTANTLLVSADGRSAGFAALDYEAPFLIEKLVKDHVVDSVEEAHALFTEVKRYFVLNNVDRTKTWKMYSLRVDEVWHQFVLFTWEYTAFGNKYFGRYLHHAPANAPDTGIGDRAPEATFDEFAERYQEVFGVELPELWDDAASVRLNRRLVNERCGDLAVKHAEGGMVDLTDAEGQVLFSVNDLAQEALVFIASTGAFYVRELPGDLTDEEKSGLVRALVDARLIRVA